MRSWSLKDAQTTFRIFSCGPGVAKIPFLPPESLCDVTQTAVLFFDKAVAMSFHYFFGVQYPFACNQLGFAIFSII